MNKSYTCFGVPLQTAKNHSCSGQNRGNREGFRVRYQTGCIPVKILYGEKDMFPHGKFRQMMPIKKIKDNLLLQGLY